MAMAVGLQRSGDSLEARRCDQCATLSANHRAKFTVAAILTGKEGVSEGDSI